MGVSEKHFHTPGISAVLLPPGGNLGGIGSDRRHEFCLDPVVIHTPVEQSADSLFCRPDSVILVASFRVNRQQFSGDIQRPSVFREIARLRSCRRRGAIAGLTGRTGRQGLIESVVGLRRRLVGGGAIAGLIFQWFAIL